MGTTSWEKKAVQKTFSYAAEFDYPLRKDEAYRRLITGKKVPLNKVFAQIDALCRKGVLKKAKGYFSLARSKARWRQQPGIIFNEKLVLAKRASFLTKLVPWVVFVGLTGSLAVGNPKKEDDVDLMVIVKPKRLWLSRGLIYFLFITLGRLFNLKLRRPGENQPRDKLCFNLFLTTNKLTLPPRQRRLFTAYQLMFLKPLVDKNKVYQRLIQTNRFWLKNYLANWLATLPENKLDRFGHLRGWRIVDNLDRVAFRAQKKYMSGRLTREKVSREAAFFHLKKRR